MKHRSGFWIGALACLLILGCTKGPTGEKDILATVNDFKLTISEFQNHLADDMEIAQNQKITEAAKKQYLEEIIQKQILIQEARRLKFDQKPKFIRTIERYWESTLIRDLMESKAQEIEKQVIVTQEDIDRRYQEMKEKDPSLRPLAEIEQKVVRKIREEKKTAMFQKWIEGLKQSANIHTNYELLDNI
jgi:Sec-independent protein translocase protein TatA